MKFGIAANNVFEMWDWVGGRYSLWSAVGLSIMIAIGPEQFDELLAGANDMDRHFREALERNLPVLLGLIGIWYRNFFGSQSYLVAPYSEALHYLPSYLQQLEMESNGKSARLDAPSSTTRPPPSRGASRAPTASTRSSRCCTRGRRSCRSTSSRC